MSILEILEDHRQHDAVAKDTRFYCLCGWVSEMPRYGYGPAEHRAHVARVLEQHERERCYEAWSSGWHDSHYQHTAHNERRGQGHPEVVYSNPYRGRS